MTPLHSKTLPNAVTHYVVFLFRILEIPRWNPGPGISWLRISVVLRTPFMEIPELYCIKLLKRALHSAPFHFTVITFDAIQSELLNVSLINERNKKAARFLPTIPSSDTIGLGVVSPPQSEQWSFFFPALYLPRALHLFMYYLLTYAFRWHREW